MFLPHGRPHIGIDNIGPFDRSGRVMGYFDPGDPRRPGSGDRFLVGQVSFRAGADEMQGQPAGQVQPGMDDVVAVPDIHDLQVVEPLFMFLDGKQVR